MKAVFQTFWRICLFRQSPAHVPTQDWFVTSVVVANLLTSIVVSLSLSPSLDSTIAALETATRVVVSLATWAALVWLATFLREHPDRFPGTITALFGCDLIITALFGLLAPVISSLGQNPLTILYLGLLVWSLAVAGFILSQALSIRMGPAVLMALGMTVLMEAAGQMATGG
jgi:hypothetical protein